MSKKTKIIAILMVVAVFMSIAAISCFAYDTGTEITFKETYTEAELQAYFTEYKDVDGVYYAGDAITQTILPNFISIESGLSEVVVLYRGSNFGTGSPEEQTWIAILKKSDGTLRLYCHFTDMNCPYYSTTTNAWNKDNIASFTADGTFTLTDAQFKATGLLWSVPGGSASGSVGTSGNTIADFLSSIGSGLKKFLPNVAEAGVDTVDILFVTEDGGLTTVAVLTIIGIITASGLGVFAMIKRKIKKI